MSEDEKPLKWLREKDDEWKWAADYLGHRLDAEYMMTLKGDAFTRFATYENVVTAIRKIQRDKPTLVMQLQGAIRQRRYRSDSNGRKPLTFTLSKETINKLTSIAKRNNTNDTAVITALVEREGVAIEAERDYEKLLKESISRERKSAQQVAACLKEQRDEALKHAERYLQLLARWELMFPEEKPAVASDEEISKLVEPRMQDLRNALGYIAFMGDLTTERFK